MDRLVVEGGPLKNVSSLNRVITMMWCYKASGYTTCIVRSLKIKKPFLYGFLKLIPKVEQYKV
jgi:hypothetical protein